jgi:hypothetical protein
MAKLSELEAQIQPGEKIDIPDEVPEERGSFQRRPTPGEPYVFQLPQEFDWNQFKVKGNRAKEVQRISASFFKDSQLTIVSAPDPAFVGAIVKTSISTLERKRGKDGPEVSDMYYLLTALGEKPSVKWTLLDWAKALERHAGGQFQSAIEWQCRCRSDVARFVQNEEGRAVEDPEKTLGCGRRLYQRDIQQEQVIDPESGEAYFRWPYTITCPDCGASLRPDIQLVRFRAVE